MRRTDFRIFASEAAKALTTVPCAAPLAYAGNTN
jgi:hypothetical protein